ncbi:MAG: glycosyltransferase [Bacteroidales bacterium]|nr:glycosyltransferase [Bacteroidales bacterium]
MHPSNIIVNALWIGNILSPTELLTIKSFIDNGHDFVLWAYDEIETDLPQGAILKDANEIFPRTNVFCYKYPNQFGHGKGSYAGFSDIFRYKLLYLKGGWWTDMDVTCLKPLDFEDEYVFRTHHSLPMVGNIMKCPPNSKLMQKCFEEAVKKVDQNNRDWHLPIQILVDNVYVLKLDKYIKNFSNQDSWNIIREFLKKTVPIPENWYVIHWVNEEWRRNNISKIAFIKSSLIFKLFEKHKIEVKPAKPLKSILINLKLSKVSFAAHLVLSQKLLSLKLLTRDKKKAV